MAGPIDVPDSAPFALRGRVVTMDAARTVLDDGVIYAGGGLLVDVRPAADGAPDGFAGTPAIATRGTIYPGLIELHNHLPYDVLPLWNVPKRYGDRSQWGSGNPEYRRLVTGPMARLGTDPHLMPAVVRYVECKALVGGVTTSQGIQLFSNAGARRFYRGLVRNVEETDDPQLPEVLTRVADVDARDAERFLARQRKNKLLLHLAEGLQDRAREHFLALEYQPGTWAITENLVGIHCAALRRPDFDVLAEHGGSMVWSPLSNLLLYGGTADVAAARAAGVRIALGSDWSPSGSKNVLDELKAARLASNLAGSVFSDAELVAMVTSEPARIIGWDAALGSLEPGKRADLVVVAGGRGDPYGQLVDARDQDVRLVVVAGRARYGTPALMRRLASAGAESLTLGGRERVFDLAHPNADPLVAGLTLGAAQDLLTAALLEGDTALRRRPRRPAFAPAADEPQWMLALDELAPTGAEMRPRLPTPPHRRFQAPAPAAGGSVDRPGSEAGAVSGPRLDALRIVLRAAAAAAAPDIRLDPLSVSDDGGFLDALTAQRNLPDGFGRRLARLLR